MHKIYSLVEPGEPMANTITTINMELQDNGTIKSAIDKVQHLHDLVKSTSVSMSGMGAGVSAKRSQTGALAQAGETDPNELSNYGKSRATAGGTGAASRDFAKQAQGLGGLVHLYATFAANIFAVSAAFKALSDAADTTNMVKGLDQIGATSGRNLGTLSKKLVEATDGAVSLREAMEATAKASTAGLSNKQIIDMGIAAKNASQVLGLSMTDALSRLSRGISKIEPELLDELGIYVKINDATAEYARRIGKSTTALTDFERRQAFANAALTQAKDKFNSIDIEANPYSKLLASLKDLIQKSLEFTNKILTPLINFLSSSPTALFAGVSAVVGLLIKQALPAIGAFRENAAKEADIAGQVAKARVETAKTAISKIQEIEGAGLRARQAKEIESVQVEADTRLAAFEASEKKLQEQLAKSAAKKNAPKALKAIEGELPRDITKEKLAAIDELGNKNTKVAAGYRDVAKSIREAQVAADLEAKRTAEHAAVRTDLAKKHEDQLNNLAKNNRAVARQQAIADAAERAALTRGIKSRAIEDTQTVGPSLAYRQLASEVDKAKLDGQLTAMQARWAKVSGSISIATQAVIGFGHALNRALIVLAIIQTAFSVVDKIWSTNSKEASVFNSNMQELGDSVANVSRTIAALSKNNIVDSNSIAGILALSNASSTLADSLTSSLAAFKANKLAMSNFDKGIDSLLASVSKVKESVFINAFPGAKIASSIVTAIFGSGVDKKMADELSKATSSALNIAAQSGDISTKTKISEILGIDTFDTESINKAIQNLSEIGRDKLVTTIQAISVTLAESNARLQTFKASTEATTKAYQEFIQSTANTSPLFKLGDALQAEASAMSAIVAGGLDEVEKAMKDFAKSPTKATLFGKGFTDELLKIKDGFLEQSDAVKAYSIQIAQTEAKLKELKNTQESMLAGDATGVASFTNTTLEISIKEGELAKLREGLSLTSTNMIATATKLFSSGVSEVFAKGAEVITTALGASAEKAAMAIDKAKTAGLTGERRALAENAIAQKSLSIQERAITTNIGLITANEKLIAAINANTATNEYSKVTAVGSTATVEERSTATANKQAATSFNEYVQSGKELSSIINDLTKAGTASVLTLNLLKSKALAYDTKIATQNASLVEVRGEKAAAGITGKMNIVSGKQEDSTKRLEQEQAVLTAKREELSISQSIVGFATVESVTAAAKLDTEIRTLAFRKEESKILEAMDKAVLSGSMAELRVQDKALSTLRDRQQIDEKTASNKANLDSINAQSQAAARLAELTKARTELEFNVASANLAIATARNEAAATLLGYSEDYVAQLKYSQELEAASLEKAKATADIKSAAQIKLDEIDKKKKDAGLSEVDSKSLTDEASRQITLRDTLLASLDVEFNKRKEIAGIIRTTTQEQAKQNRTVKLSEDVISTLSSNFGTAGKKLGILLGSMSKFVISTDKSTKSQKALADTISSLSELGINTSKEQEEYSKNEAKNKQDEIASIAEVAGATKNMFAEKTFAYKAFKTVEQTMSLISIGLKIKEILLDKAFTISSIAESGKRVASTVIETGKDIAGAVAKAFGQLGPIGGTVAAAAILAFMASLGASSNKSINMAGITAKDHQETQGTGLSWVDNKKVENGRGVLGDTAAKSESIKNSLEILKDNSVEGLSLSNDMVDILKSIDKGIGSVSKSLYSVQGIRTGSAFGTSEGTSGGSFLGWGKKVSVNIADAGVAIQGSFVDLMSNTANTIRQYETSIITTSSSSWFGLVKKTSQSINTQFGTLDKNLQKSISDIFTNASELFIKAGDRLGMSAESILTRLGSLSIDQLVSLKDLKGTELEKEFNSVISSILDDASNALFSALSQFQKFGEGMLETTLRVIDGNDKVNLALKSMGKAALNDAKELNVATIGVTEALINNASDLSTFIEQTNTFKSNFLNASEKLDPIQTSIVARMKELGFSMTDTREEFKNLVLGLDLTTTYGQKTFQTLMGLQESFSMVYASTSDLNSALVALLDAQGKTAESTAAQRLAELDGLTEMEKAIKIRVYALEDEKNLLDDLRTSRNDEQEALKTSIDSIKSYIKTLADFKLSLLGGASSILTPEQKYKQAKSEAQRISNLATGPANTIAEVEARNAALDKLPTVLQDFLDASRTSFASSAQYTTDFNSVMNILDNTGAALEAQKTDQEKQLEALLESTKFLDSIDSGVKSLAELASTTNSLLSNYAIMQTNSGEPSAAALAAVEASLKNADVMLAAMRAQFESTVANTPDKTIIPIVDSSTQALQAQLTALVKEVQGLRNDNAEQTAATITANAVAEAANAASIVQAQQYAAERTQWNISNVPTVDNTFLQSGGGGY